MTAAHLVVVSFAAAVSLAAQPPGSKGKVVQVQIITNSHTLNETRCANIKEPLSPTTILVDTDGKPNDVHHCVDGKLLSHADEKKQPDLFKKTLVQLSARDSIQWIATSPFRVAQIRRHVEEGQKPNPNAPHYPFLEPLSTAYATTVTVGPVLDLTDVVVQQYKVNFEFEKFGLVDPDFVCSM